MTGVIETSSGDLLRFGEVTESAWDDDDFDELTETIRDDVPKPCYAKGDSNAPAMTRWTGIEWALVPQP